MSNNKFLKKSSPREVLNIDFVSRIFNETHIPFEKGGPYASDMYPPGEWKKIIKWLLEQGYNENEIKEILYSKLMRWASDARGDKPYGKATLADFKRFVIKKDPRTKKNEIDLFLDRYVRKNESEILLQSLSDFIREDAVGGVSAPMSTPMNTPGMGNAQPASNAAMTGSQQASNSAIGSGDKFDASIGPMYTQGGKKPKTKKVNEENINPHDKLGVAMAKKMGVKLPFKKGKGKKDVEQKKIDENTEDVIEMMSFSDWSKKSGNGHKISTLSENKNKIISMNESLMFEEDNSGLKLGGVLYHVIHNKNYKVYVSEEGILGKNNILIPWTLIKSLEKKYSK